MMFLRRDQIAGMTHEERRQYKHELLLYRAQVTALAEEANSPIAARILQRKKDELQNVRDEYASIAIRGIDPADVIYQLTYMQSRERFLRADIQIMESPENDAEEVDKAIEVCNDAITQSEKSSRMSR